jgi:hypothetical protein
MICPNCKSEYRPGFTSCSDCHVGLVEKLPARNSPTSFAVLWRGEDPIFRDMLIEDLDRAGIRYADVPLDIYARHSDDAFNLRIIPQFGFVVSVATGNLRASREILEKLLDQEPEDASLPESEEESDEAVSVDVPEMPLHWDPELATLEVWHGTDRRRARFLEASLREVGIPCRILEDGPEKLSLLVCPENAASARELMHQIAEAAVPEEPLPRPANYLWYDEPVRSYAFAWLPAVAYFAILVFVYIFLEAPSESSFHSVSFVDGVVSLVSFASEIGTLWMSYQAIRYEIRPFRFVLLAFLPLSFVWYYYERYLRRSGPRRLPIAVRMRLSPPTA